MAIQGGERSERTSEKAGMCRMNLWILSLASVFFPLVMLITTLQILCRMRFCKWNSFDIADLACGTCRDGYPGASRAVNIDNFFHLISLTFLTERKNCMSFSLGIRKISKT